MFVAVSSTGAKTKLSFTDERDFSKRNRRIKVCEICTGPEMIPDPEMIPN